MEGVGMTNKWFRRFMSVFLALVVALNPLDTRSFITKALATAPESAGMSDVEKKATPGLSALGKGVAKALGPLLGALGSGGAEEAEETEGTGHDAGDAGDAENTEDAEDAEDEDGGWWIFNCSRREVVELLVVTVVIVVVSAALGTGLYQLFGRPDREEWARPGETSPALAHSHQA